LAILSLIDICTQSEQPVYQLDKK